MEGIKQLSEILAKAGEQVKGLEEQGGKLQAELEAERKKNQVLQKNLEEGQGRIEELEMNIKMMEEENRELKGEGGPDRKLKRGGGEDLEEDGNRGKKQKKDDDRDDQVNQVSTVKEQREPWKYTRFAEVLKVINDHSKRVTNKMSPLSTSDLLNCRLVCSGMKKAVDTFLVEDNRVNVMYNLDKNPWQDLKNLSGDINPFPFRSLYYMDYSMAYLDIWKCREEFVEFLQKFGKHIWNFNAEFGSECAWNERSGWYLGLCQMVELMPNLKSLRIISPMWGWWEYDDHSEIRKDEDMFLDIMKYCDISIGRRQQWLQRDIDSKRFPAMMNLKSVVFEDCPLKLIDAVLKSNRQHLEKIGIRRSPGNWHEFDSWSLRDFEVTEENDSYLEMQRRAGNLGGGLDRRGFPFGNSALQGCSRNMFGRWV